MAVHEFVTGEVITADNLNSVGGAADSALSLGTTNERDIADIYGIVHALTTEDATGKSISATTDIVVPANGIVAVYVF